MMTKKWPLIAAGAVLLAFGVWFFGLREPAEIDQAPVGKIQRVARVERGDLDLTVSADGVVAPINKVELKSKASGLIEELNFVEGQQVTKGDLLIALDQRTTLNDYEQAKADLELAEANAMQQENNYRRSLELHEKNLISQQERDQANVEYVRAKSSLVKARAALSSADERLRDTRIRAPITGIILTKNVEIGQIISSGVSNVGGGTLLATLADMNQVYVETNVDEVDIGRVTVGQKARVVADAYPEESFVGEVVRIAPLGKTTQNVTVFNVIVQVTNRGGRLKAGMSASVELEVFRRQGVLLVPNEALKDPESDEGKALLASMRTGPDTATPPGGGAAPAPDGGMDFRAMRERMQSASPEERERMRQEFRARLERMSPEERERFRAMRRDGGGGPGMQGGGERRQSQVAGTDVVKDRIVMVKEGNSFAARRVKVGVSNFDSSEVISGLQEGDEIEITTISRAKVAAAEWNERMRSRQGVGGMSTGTGRR